MATPAAGPGEGDGHFRALIEAVPLVTFTLAVEDGSITSLNPAFERLTGWPAGDWIGRSMTALAHRDDTPALIACLHQITLGEVPSPFEVRLSTRSGDFVTAELTMEPQLKGGQVRRILGFARDVSDRRAVVRDLLAAKEAAEAANHAKTEFLANMSHEIRTPLNAIIGMSGLMIDMPLEEQVRTFAETIRSSGQTLLRLINDILDFSKIESGKLELESQPFSLDECVAGAVEMVGAAASQKGVALDASLSEDCPPALFGDVTRVRQVLVNLLSNAVKFTPEGGSVTLEVDARGLGGVEYEVRFAVRDTGIGIAPDKQERIFDVFSQADASTTRRFGGTGLGLSISKRLTELMGGAISVSSSPGQGSTFSFTIRGRAVRRTQRPTAEIERVGIGLAERYPLRILLAEDHPTNQQVAVLMLERLGYEGEWVDVVDNGQMAIERLEERRYDLVFMDVHMPVLDGIEATRRICARWPSDERPRIVAMTASTMKGDREKCLAAGMDDFISKPIFEKDLVEVLELCGKRALGLKVAEERPEVPEPPPPVVDGQIDPAAVQRFRGFKPEKMVALVENFLENARQGIERIRRAAAHGQASEVQLAAHSLKGSCTMFGLVRMTEVSAALELRAKEGSIEGAGAAVEELLAELDSAGPVLRRELLGAAG